MDDLTAAVDAVLPSVRQDLERLVRIRSVSADPAQADAVRMSAEAVAVLARSGGAAQADVLTVAGGAPAVVANWPAPVGAPTVLLYAHHDVQPTGPWSEWSSEPFGPVERGGRLFGRGAADDKAGIMAHLAAVRSFGGRPPVGVVLFVEGEEEVGSPTFATFLRTYRERLAADIIVVADSMNWSVDTPALTTTLRGAVDCVVELRVLDHAVHSGLFGGPVVDALTSLCRLLATLHDDAGDVAVPGLISSVAPDLNAPVGYALDFPEARFRAEARLLDGVRLSGTGPLADRLWTRPAISVVGIDAPSVADAANVLVHRARAKVSLRLAPAQDPRVALKALADHLRSHVEFGATVTVTAGMVGAGCELDTTLSAFQVAEQSLAEAFGTEPVRIGIGGSIPFIAEFREVFPDAAVVVTGVEDPDSRAHGVDESLHLGQFAMVCLAETLLLDRLARPGWTGVAS